MVCNRHNKIGMERCRECLGEDFKDVERRLIEKLIKEYNPNLHSNIKLWLKKYIK